MNGKSLKKKTTTTKQVKNSAIHHSIFEQYYIYFSIENKLPSFGEKPSLH